MHRVRAFWATLCEEVQQPFVVTPTAGNETLGRERLSVGYEWEKRLKWMNRNRLAGRWDKVDIRRLTTLASTTARNWLRDEFRKDAGIYRVDKRATREIVALESDISDRLDNDIFDMSISNGIRDRQIVIEAMARGYDILASNNNVNSIKHARLRHWIALGAGKELGIHTTILAPDLAEEALRFATNQSIGWIAAAAMRTCVTDPGNRNKALQELEVFTRDFKERGMDNILANMLVELDDEAGYEKAMRSVRRHGMSKAGRGELLKEHHIAGALSRKTGVSEKELMGSVAALQP